MKPRKFLPVEVSCFKVEDGIIEKAAQHKKHKKTGFYHVILFPLTERKRGNTGNCPHKKHNLLRTVSRIYSGRNFLKLIAKCC